MIEVDGIATKEVEPFGLRKLGHGSVTVEQ